MKNLIGIILAFSLIFFLSWSILDTSCKLRYWDAIVMPLAWCMVKYKWSYITEELYKKAFEQNINLNQK